MRISALALLILAVPSAHGASTLLVPPDGYRLLEHSGTNVTVHDLDGAYVLQTPDATAFTVTLRHGTRTQTETIRTLAIVEPGQAAAAYLASRPAAAAALADGLGAVEGRLDAVEVQVNLTAAEMRASANRVTESLARLDALHNLHTEVQNATQTLQASILANRPEPVNLGPVTLEVQDVQSTQTQHGAALVALEDQVRILRYTLAAATLLLVLVLAARSSPRAWIRDLRQRRLVARQERQAAQEADEQAQAARLDAERLQKEARARELQGRMLSPVLESRTSLAAMPAATPGTEWTPTLADAPERPRRRGALRGAPPPCPVCGKQAANHGGATNHLRRAKDAPHVEYRTRNALPSIDRYGTTPTPGSALDAVPVEATA